MHEIRHKEGARAINWTRGALAINHMHGFRLQVSYEKYEYIDMTSIIISIPLGLIWVAVELSLSCILGRRSQPKHARQ